jgi:hypothetical protein
MIPDNHVPAARHPVPGSPDRKICSKEIRKVRNGRGLSLAAQGLYGKSTVRILHL